MSASLGDLAGFPWWDHVEREIARMTPLDRVGTPERPYDDLDQGWQIVIWRDAGFVYVLEHNEPCTTVFRTWFRVPLHVWMDAWRQAIRGG